MRIGIPLRRAGADRSASPVPLEQAVAAALETAGPVGAIEVSLTEAVGLVLAEPVVADVDLPPFDRASGPGYAVRAAEATPGALLRVARPWSDDGHEIEPGEAAPVEPGDPMPLGADAVIDPFSVRPDPADGPARVVEILRPVAPGRAVVKRGATLAAAEVLAGAGERLRPAMVPLLAAQGCVHPLCHRRVRVAIVAVGEHLISPADAPVLHHERNAANLAVAALLLGAGGMVHDLGAVAEADFPRTFERALSAHLVLVLGRLGDEGYLALEDAGFEPTSTGPAIEPGGGPGVGHGVVRDDDGRVETHVVALPLDPTAAVVAASLLVLPLLARLQGEESPNKSPLRAIWDAPQPATGTSLRAVPATLHAGADGRLRARAAVAFGTPDLPDLALADGLALFPPGQGPWHGGEVVAFTPFAPWPGRSDG